jgi:hypothetical protein
VNRRSTPQKTIDDRAFPVRVVITVPERGFERQYDAMSAWLVGEVGRGNFAHHGSGRRLPDASAFYFRTTEDAHRFRAAFPNLVLNDRTTCSTYNSPYVSVLKRGE